MSPSFLIVFNFENLYAYSKKTLKKVILYKPFLIVHSDILPYHVEFNPIKLTKKGLK